MRKGLFYGLCLCMVLSALYVFPSFAGVWTVWTPDSSEDVVIGDYPIEGYIDPDDLEDEEDVFVASPSNATPSNAKMDSGASGEVYGVSVYASWAPYDSSISSSVVNYMSDILPKLGNVDYVFFRSGQYTYRLVYGDDLVVSGSVFRGSDCKYVAYDTRNYIWTNGQEGDFTLNAGSALVYSDLGFYPVLGSGESYVWAVLLALVILLLFQLLRPLFSFARFYV